MLMRLTDPAVIEEYCRRDPLLHIYELGDLDPFFFPHTAWHGWEEKGKLTALCLVYSGLRVATLLAFTRRRSPAMRRLLETLSGSLPGTFYAHLSTGLGEILGHGRTAVDKGLYLKMGLTHPAKQDRIDTDGVERLTPDDETEIMAFYDRSFAENWFDPRMLETGGNFGMRIGGRLVSVAGVHVYSPARGVAALGNVATDPAYRGQGYGKRTVARLCRELRRTVGTIGLNVRADNRAALRLYRSLGFTKAADFHEWKIMPVE